MEKEEIKLRSQEVQEILKKMPHSLIMWGNSIIAILILLMLLLAFFIKYPNVFQVPVIIKANNPAEQFKANRNGKIERIFFNDSDTVSRGDVIAIMKNAADFNDVMKLKSVIDSITDDQFEGEIIIPIQELSYANYGSIQPHFRELEKTYSLYEVSKKNRKDEKKYKLQMWEDISTLRNEIYNWEATEVYRASLGGKLSMLNLWYKNQNVKTDEVLFSITPKQTNGFVGRIETDVKNLTMLKDIQFLEIILESGTNSTKIEGEIKSISSAESLGKINLTVGFNQMNEKILNSILVEVRSVRGMAEIVTEDQRLIERFFQNVRGKIPFQ